MRNWILYVGLGLVLSAIGIVAAGSLRAAQPSKLPSGAVAISADLVDEFEETWKRVEKAQETVKIDGPRLEQIVRISLDRAGVKASQFGEYQFDRACNCSKKREVK